MSRPGVSSCDLPQVTQLLSSGPTLTPQMFWFLLWGLFPLHQDALCGESPLLANVFTDLCPETWMTP